MDKRELYSNMIGFFKFLLPLPLLPPPPEIWQSGPAVESIVSRRISYQNLDKKIISFVQVSCT